MITGAIEQFQNDLQCVKLYEVRMHDRLKLLRDLSLNEWKIPAFDVPTWLTNNNFIETIEDNNEKPVVQLTERGEEYLKILETAEGDRPGSMYFNSSNEEKNAKGPMHGYPLYSECSLHEDVTHSTPTSKLGEYLNPARENKETGEYEYRPFEGRWVRFDGEEYHRL